MWQRCRYIMYLCTYIKYIYVCYICVYRFIFILRTCHKILATIILFDSILRAKQNICENFYYSTVHPPPNTSSSLCTPLSFLMCLYMCMYVCMCSEKSHGKHLYTFIAYSSPTTTTTVEKYDNSKI